tara:strand:- start:161 stop:334 length:174 start_codon:yes stop_codon:yes gene_type:complete
MHGSGFIPVRMSLVDISEAYLLPHRIGARMKIMNCREIRSDFGASQHTAEAHAKGIE